MTKKLSLFLLGFLLAVTAVIGGWRILQPVKAEDDGVSNEIVIDMNDLINDSFDSASSSYPSSPSNWSGSAMTGQGSSIVSGVISLNVNSLLATEDKNTYKLPIEEFWNNTDINKAMLISPDDMTRSNNNVLMISSPVSTAYSYNSAAYEIQANSYYKLKIWVYTPDYSSFAGDYNNGAFISISGDINAVSEPINTKNTWKDYSLYFSGYSYKNASINVSLQLGDYRTDKDDNPTTRLSSGYAFFDSVLVQPISYDTYTKCKSAPIAREFFADNLINDVTPVDFNGDFENQTKGWTLLQTDAVVGIESSEVYLPFGSQALKMSSEGRGTASAGYRSSALNIDRHKYYRIGIWQNNALLTNGTATANIITIDNNGNEKSLATLSSFTQDLGENSWLGDWKQGSFFIQGSTLFDKEIYLELWFGRESAKAEGTIYWDKITIEELLPADYTSGSANGTVVTFGDPAGNATLANGNFYNIDAYEEYKYPMPVASWTPIENADNKNSTVAGIIRTDYDHFMSNKSNYNNPAYPYSDNVQNRNILMIANKTRSAYGYSASTTVAANTYKKITVNLRTQVTEDAYGAELILKSNDIVISRHKNIHSEDSFSTYTFMVKSGYAEQALTLEICLGMEGGFNNENYTSGHLFVDFADSVDSDETAYNSASGIAVKKYDFSIENFEAFNETDYSLKTPSNWVPIEILPEINTVKAGIMNLNSYDAFVLDGVSKAKIGTDNLSPNALIIFSSDATAYGMKRSFPITYTADLYYKITVRIKTVNIPKDTGARILLNSDNYFENINTEYIENNFKNNFIEYSFYVNVGAASSVSHNIEIWLGSNEKTYTRASGCVIVDQITYNEISASEYADGITDLASEDEDEVPYNVAKVVLSQVAEEEAPITEPEKAPFPWWTLPTVLFSVLLLLILIVIIVKGIIPRRKKKTQKGISAYDRRKTINININKNAPDKTAKNVQTEPVPEVETKIEETDITTTQEQTNEQAAAPVKKLIRRKKYTPKEYKDYFED